MARKIAMTRNVQALNRAYQNLKMRETDEGLGLVFGAPGLGKTTGACALFVAEQGVLVTAKPGWRQRALLESLLTELGADSRHATNAQKLDEVIRLLAEAGRPVFVDEADFLFADRTSLETLRVLHDVSGVPVLLIGMNSVAGSAGIDKRVRRYPQIADRILEWVEFGPANLSDVRLIAGTVWDGQLSEDLAQYLLRDTKGNIRQIKVRMQKVKSRAQVLQLRELDLDAFLGREQANAERKLTALRVAGE